MSNTKMCYCPQCDEVTTFYNVEDGVWECDDCGYELGDDEDEYEDEDFGEDDCYDEEDDEDYEDED